MKNPKTTSVLVGLGLVLVVAYGYARGTTWSQTSTNTFINNTGRAVGGLHIKYNTVGWGSVCVVVYQNPANTFADVQTDGSGQFNLSSGTVAAGSSVQITVSDPSVSWPGASDLSVQTWWWTDGSGILVGQTHNGCEQPDCTSP